MIYDYNKAMTTRLAFCALIALIAITAGCAVNPVSGDRDFVTISERAFAEVDKALHQVNQSYTRLTASQIAEIKAPEISIIRADAGHSFSSLARKSAINYDAESILRLLNRAFPSGELKTGKISKSEVFHRNSQLLC